MAHMNHNLYKFCSLFMICIFHAHNESSNLKYDCNNTTIYNVYKQVGSQYHINCDFKDPDN